MEKIFLSCLNFLINSLCFGSLVVHLNVYNHPEVPVFQMNIISIDLLPYNITHFYVSNILLIANMLGRLATNRHL